MGGFWEAVLFAVGVTVPSMLLLLFGMLLRRSGQINGDFCAQAAKLVFNYGLPTLLFVNLLKGEIHYGEQLVLLAAGVGSTLLLYFGAELYAWRFVPETRDKGVFVQGVFRSNLGIMGLAFVQNAYGDGGLAAGAVYMGVVTILFNILAVITLSRSAEGSWAAKMKVMGGKIITNPLIVAIVLALALQALALKVPRPLLQTAQYVGNISLPLALICAGATFDMKSMLKMSDISLQASIGRLVVAPLVAVAVGLLLGLEGVPMGVLFLMTATPVAATSYVMAKVMGGNDVAAANITGITTLGALFSAAVGIVALRSMGLM
ncbi:AEC family transporter [Uruburuella testudinis]|uniref:AEC family transporter n=1 Tax=Uruburuella testudinis TaxID=1282863 RepID=A0ABY4DSZ3_9NEIS|nr:AEC family transporter [Uruburuella testudinis]UOO82159.1 AEC family transporter [Uruburuella testudinis]